MPESWELERKGCCGSVVAREAWGLGGALGREAAAGTGRGPGAS